MIFFFKIYSQINKKIKIKIKMLYNIFLIKNNINNLFINKKLNNKFSFFNNFKFIKIFKK